MNVVSFETAKLLKKAGFPQPSEIDPANSWLIFYVEPSEEGGVPELCSADRIENIRSFSDPCEIVAFAPTATDLIPPGWYLLNHQDPGNFPGRKIEKWACICYTAFYNDNPAEAAAQAWLHVNKTRYGTHV